MAAFELRYLQARGVREIVDVDDADEAEALARRRLLFQDPGFTIAVLHQGVELTRVSQRPHAQPSDFVRVDHGR